MMELPQELRYTPSHEWIQIEKGIATIGITDFAQQQLGDITYVELPQADDELSGGQEAAVVESVKAASDVFAPISGTVVEVNDLLEESPERINADPYGDGWLYRVRMSVPDEEEELLTAEEYDDLLPKDDA